MPWCEPCERFWNPVSITQTGECPTCGSPVESAPEAAPEAAPAPKVPWHFWIGLVAAAAYLGWRAIQGIALLF